MLLLYRRLTLPEEARVGIIFAKGGATLTYFMTLNAFLIRLEAAAFWTWRGFARPVIVNRVRFIVGRVGIDILTVHAIALEVVVRAGRAINRDLVEVRSAQSADLRIGIGEQTPLQQRIVSEVQPRYDVARMESSLFVFGEEVIRVAVEDHFADALHRHQLFRNQLGRIQQVKIIFEFIFFRDELEAQFILRIIARFDGFPQFTAMEIRIAPRQFLRLIPDQRGFTRYGLPVETNKRGFTFGVNQPEGVDAKTFHGAIATRDTAIGHRPHHVVQGFRLQGNIIPEGVMGALSLGNGPVWLGFNSMDEVGKLMRVLNKEDRRVVAHQVKDTFVGIKFGGEPADITHRIGGACTALYR